jgi:hypothetical protein
VPACGPLHLRAAQVWLRLGVTVMIGQNDIRGERFTVANARGLTAFAGRYHLVSLAPDVPHPG